MTTISEEQFTDFLLATHKGLNFKKPLDEFKKLIPSWPKFRVGLEFEVEFIMEKNTHIMYTSTYLS